MPAKRKNLASLEESPVERVIERPAGKVAKRRVGI
jgi:hypothetical protein